MTDTTNPDDDFPITRSYHCRIELGGEPDLQERIVDRAFDIAGNADVTGFDGCPACGPYVEATAEDHAEIVRWRSGVLAFIATVSEEAPSCP